MSDDELVDLTLDEVRRAIAVRLTDGPIQELAAIQLRADTLLDATTDAHAREVLSSIVTSAARALAGLREIRTELGSDTYDVMEDEPRG